MECPTGSGQQKTLWEVAQEVSRRLSHIFLRKDGRRAVYGDVELFQKDPYWRDLILFYEYFNGDNGAGLGASHQTGLDGAGGQIDRAERGIAAARSTPVRSAQKSVTRPNPSETRLM